MGGLVTKVKSQFEADSVFSYSTVKLVVIRDRKLGIIHYCLQFAIFVYIVVYTILYQQRYLLLEIPYGRVRATVREPATWVDAKTLPYCLQNQPSYSGYENFECAYMTGADATFPPAQENSLLVATRIKDTYYSAIPNCSTSFAPPTTLDCAPSKNETASNRYYLGNIEQYTVFMEHAIFGQQNHIVVANSECHGQFIFRNGSKAIITFDDQTRKGDILPLSTIINAARVTSLDETSGVQQTYRYDGVFIVAVITYTNYVTNPSKLKYTYELYSIPKQDIVGMQKSEATPTGTVQRNWYGVQLVFLVVGSIGKFDFPTLLSSLVSGTVLLNVATIVVDMLILHIMPEKKAYQKHKFETTDSFKMAKITKAGENTSIDTPLLADDHGSFNPPEVVPVASSYQTLKLVVILDRRLGIIHYLLEFGIFLYIIVYTVVIQQRYLLSEAPYGTIRATLQQPPVWSDTTQLPYCSQNQAEVNSWPTNECVYLLGTDVTYPPGLVDSVFATTRVKDTTIRVPPNCTSLPSTLRCAPNVSDSTSARYYTADIENYTVYMEHSIFGRENEIMMTNLDCTGELLFQHTGKSIKFTGRSRGGDIVDIRTLLEAAGVPTLDAPSGTGGNSSMRYDGALIITVVSYHNEAQHPKRFSYTYELYHLPGVNVITQEPSVTQPDGTLVQRSFYGVRFLYLVVGTIGYFDFPTLLQTLVAGAVLIKLSTTAVDLLLLHVLPDKARYKKSKYEYTQDFSDARADNNKL